MSKHLAAVESAEHGPASGRPQVFDPDDCTDCGPDVSEVQPDNGPVDVTFEEQVPTITSLEDPGPPIMLTVKIDQSGAGQSRYLCHPTEAVRLLREIADQIEAETVEQ